MATKNYNDEKKEYMQEFVNSSRELLDDVEPQILALEKNAENSGVVDDEILNTIFRLFHTLKGTAGFVDLTTITSVTHEAETLLDLFRKGEGTLNTKHVDLLCRTSDFVRTILDTVENQLDESEFKGTADEIVGDLQQVITTITKKEDDSAAAEKPPEVVLSVEEIKAPQAETAPALDEMKLIITPEMVQRFSQESQELCEEAEMMLLAFERVPDNLELATTAFRALHSLKGNAGFFGYAELEHVSHIAESVLDRIRSGEKKAEPPEISALLSTIDFVRNCVRQLGAGKPMDLSGYPKLTGVLELLAGQPAAIAPVEKKAADIPFAEMASDENGSDENGSDGEPGEISRTQKQSGAKDQPGPAQEKTEKQSGTAKDRAADDASSKSTVQQVIRIDIEKLDMLLDLVGEMVISEAMVASNPDLRGLQLPRFEKAVLQLDKITRNIQEVALSMRMIPIAQTFHKMERLVRDLSVKAQKKINLQIVGEETEVDKTIIEQISDPLVHLIRNSVDHGLESLEERRAAGKSETGHIKLEAKHSAGEVWITVEDDGKGLDRAKILKKAVEKGLVDEDAAPGMKDEDVWKLIFEPGFSTAEKVSSISGRGVGMDVVKKNIEKMRGKIDIRTRSGQGSMMVLRIPLTLAIIEGMVIRVGGSRYTIPINSICESIKPKQEQITVNPDGMEIVRIRGELLPVIRLHELYDTTADYEKLTDGLLIIVENNEKKCCLFADELIGQQQIVIKGLSGYLGHVQGVSGCAILGDGDISLILDIGDLINAAETGNKLCADKKNHPKNNNKVTQTV